MKRTLLIDGDIFAYQIAAASERPIDWGGDLWTLHSDMAEARIKLYDRLQNIQETLEADDMIVCLSDDDNFRKRIYPKYKSNRDGKRRPMILVPLKEYIEDTYTTYKRPSLEADDVLGILSTSKKIVKGERVIVSMDKDLKTIPGLFYNLNNPEFGVQVIDEAEADYWHMYQTLCGDTSDGYPGCPGVGPKKAERLLEGLSPADMWPAVAEAFVKAKLSEQEALVMARVARILRVQDYNFQKKEPHLWKP